MFENKRQRRKWALVLAASLGLGLLPGCASQLEESPIYYADSRSSQTSDTYASTSVADGPVEKINSRTVIPPPTNKTFHPSGQNEAKTVPTPVSPPATKKPLGKVSASGAGISHPPQLKPKDKVAAGPQRKASPAADAAQRKSASTIDHTATPANSRSDGTVAPMPGDQRFYIDLGSFQDQESVSQIATRLTELGLPVERRAVRVGERTFLRLTAGPFPFRAEAEWAAALLKEKTGMEGTIVM
ncbi:MAG: SPOR domain-containing protein [Magnetococcus sp. DMHC-1]